LSLVAGCSGDDSSDSSAATDPGRVTMHRLNRTEYNNTVRDLLGTALRPAEDFPADDHGYGFDNISDVLSMSPLQLELYERAAEALATEAMAVPVTAQKTKVEAETLKGTAGAKTPTAWNIYSPGEVSYLAKFPSDGKYAISVRMWGDQAGADPARADISVGGMSLGVFDVKETASKPIVVKVETPVAAGSKEVSVRFVNDLYDPMNGLDRNLYVDWIEIEGPLDKPGKNPLRDAIVTCNPLDGDGCVRNIVAAFGKRAWRRPLTSAEVDGLMGLVALAKKESDSVDVGITLALRAILVSPHFLFRVERDPSPTATTPHALDGWELASRLSYFLWSSMPDAELFKAAEDGKLADEQELAKQVTRMLSDPKAEALVDNFAGQWLHTRALADHAPDYQYFPQFDAPLRDGMRAEARLFFGELISGDRPITDLVSTDFTYVDQRLAKHYGLDAVSGSGFVRTTLKTDQRGGLLTQGAWLTVTSYPTRTSPVKRGKWILSNLLCKTPDPPPPGVEGLITEMTPTGSLRQRLELHRAAPVCASCHKTMDPLGFALEHYDGIGAFRTTDNGFAIDATGELPDGTKFDGAKQMAKAIQKDPRFGHCVTEKLFTYALGRAPTNEDGPYLQRIESEFAAGGSKLKDLVRLIAASEPFRMRRGEPEGGGQ
jgi:hypothetical protein